MQQQSHFRANDPKPGPNDTQGLKMIMYFNEGPYKNKGFKQNYTGQKIPPEFISANNPQKYCDKYAYGRIMKQMDKKKGLWRIIIICDIRTDQRIEMWYIKNGLRCKTTFTQYRFELISQRDMRYKIILPESKLVANG